MPSVKLAVPLLLLLALQLFGECQAAGPSMRGVAARAEASVFDLVETELGVEWRQAMETLVSSTSDLWQTMYKTLPKNEQGSLDATATQYALNRFFLQRYRWRVRGLASTGTAWGENTSLLVVEERMPVSVREYFEHRVFNQGMVQEDLAALAATIALLIHDDATAQLKSAYRVLGLDAEKDVSADRARDVLAVYTTCYKGGLNVSKHIVSEEWWRANVVPEAQAEAVYSNVAGYIQGSAFPGLDAYSFQQVQAIVKVAMEAHVQYVHDIATKIKNNLKTFEGSSSGRVSLSEVYKSYVEKNWTMFDERREFMQQLGVLDESDAAQTRVIVPNYMLNPLNCAGPWSYYTVCWVNECEFVMSDLERELGSPEATPGVIAEKVAFLPSASVSAPRMLSRALVRKLEEVAEHHGGKVPIHGRLFFQWMHFAYPLECPYPFPSEMVRPMSETEFTTETGLEANYNREEMENMTKVAPDVPAPSLSCDENADQCLAMWTPVEELVQHRKMPQRSLYDEEREGAKASSTLATILRFLALLATAPVLVNAIRQMGSASLLTQQLLSGRVDIKKGYLP